MTNITVTQEVVEFYESQAQDFFGKIFNCNEMPLVTDISQLSDFNHFWVPQWLSRNIELEFDVEKQKNENITKSEEWVLFSKVYNRHWDKWIVDQINSEYCIEVKPNIKMIDLFKLIEKGEVESKQRQQCNLH